MFIQHQSHDISSSSCRAISTDIPDPFSPTSSLAHCFRQVFKATSRIGTELLYVGSSWPSCLCSSMWRGPHNKKSRKLHRTYITCFQKLPHFSEIITKEICRVIYKEELHIQLTHSGPSLRQRLTKKNNNTITTFTLANCPIRDRIICQKKLYHLICLKCHTFYIWSTIRPLHIRIKEHLNLRISSFRKHLIKCKNTDINFPLK